MCLRLWFGVRSIHVQLLRWLRIRGCQRQQRPKPQRNVTGYGWPRSWIAQVAGACACACACAGVCMYTTLSCLRPSCRLCRRSWRGAELAHALVGRYSSAHQRRHAVSFFASMAVWLEFQAICVQQQDRGCMVCAALSCSGCCCCASW